MTDTDKPSFLDRMRDAALQRDAAEAELRNQISRLVIGERRGDRLGHVITVQPVPEALTVMHGGSFVVEVITRVDRNTEQSMWATAHEGASDSWRWHSEDQALLHLIALRKGQRDDRGDIVTFASRVIGFDDSPT